MALDAIQFLVNIVIVAHSDGKLSASELALIESIRSEMKVKKSDFTAAIKSVEQSNCKITPVGSFADQVKNLELIIKLAYVDNDLNDTEKFLIKEFSQAAGIYEDQLERMLSHAMTSLKEQGKICPGCGSSADSQACFCQKCGASLFEQDTATQVDLEIPSSGIAIEFAESTAASYPKALELAKAADGFQTCQRNKKSWYLASYPAHDIEQVIPLCNALSGIRNRRVYVHGKESLWDEVFGFVWCATRRSIAYRPVEYCFGNDEHRINPWGCKQANMEWSDWAQWFCYGRWEKAGIFGGKVQFRFDKERIKHEIATNFFKFRFCPYLKTDLSTAVLKYLPEIVMPESDKNWGYRRVYDQAPGSIKVIEKNDTFSCEYWSDGVRPIGHNVLVDILSKALRDTGNNSISVSHLIK